MTVKVVLWGDLSREHTGGVKEFEVEAGTYAASSGLSTAVSGLAKKLEEDSTVAIDGELYDTAFHFTGRM